MKQINNGFADCYYLLEDGTIYNSATDKTIKPNKEHTFNIKTIDNKRKKISLKTLYKLVYNKIFCIDNIQDLDNELWKEIDDTNGNYYVSNKGRIKSLHGYQSIILKGFITNNGYIRVDIKEDGNRQTKFIHRLVAAAFLPEPRKIDMHLHHKDFNKLNNAADNLQWLTAAEHHKLHIERNKENAICTESEEDSYRKNN